MAKRASALAAPGKRWQTLARVGSVEVRVDRTWWAMLATSGLLVGLAAHRALGIGPSESSAVGVGFALALAASIVTHEAGHALVGTLVGLEPVAIQGLWLGGATVYRRSANHPRQKALSAASGPAANLLVAAASAGLASACPSSPVGLVALAVAGLNAGYALLNLVPAYPQDGGHLLHSLLWWALDDEARGLRRAGQIGLVLAAVVMVVGVTVGVQWALLTGALLISQSIFLALASAKAIMLA